MRDENAHMFEKFSNADYGDLNDKDFRSIRHKKREVYRDTSFELNSELEELVEVREMS